MHDCMCTLYMYMHMYNVHGGVGGSVYIQGEPGMLVVNEFHHLLKDLAFVEHVHVHDIVHYA